MERASAIAPVETLQPPYNMLRRDVEDEILPYCRENNIGVIVYSPMASGLLTGKMTRERIENMPSDDWRRDSEQFNDPKLSRNLELVETAAGDRGEAWAVAGRGGDCLDLTATGGHGRHSGGPLAGSGRRHRRRRGFPPLR